MIHTKAVADVSGRGEFWKLFCLGGWGRNDSCLTKKVAWGGLGVTRNYAN